MREYDSGPPAMAGGLSPEELRRKLLFIHARERDRQLWLVAGLKISLEEYHRRYVLVIEASARDTIRL